MAVTLRNDFVVRAPLEQTWRVLTDPQRLGSCLPGATIGPAGDDGRFTGEMRVKLGPVELLYDGTGRIEEADAARRVAVFAVEGRERRGQGSASARIRSRATPEGDAVRVTVDTELDVSGRPAQFGRGIMEDVAGGMLDHLAQRLPAVIAGDPAGPPAVTEDEPEAFDAGRSVRGALARRVAVSAACALAGAAIGIAIDRALVRRS